MKKQLLAAAALALVSGVAAAQTATVYGFLDAGVFTTNNGSTSGQSLTTMGQAGGNWFPSMYGITGSEDLGGGMKATFNLQGSLNPAKGQGGSDLGDGGIFDRYATVGLSGSAGSVELGRQIDLLFLQSFVNGVIPTHSNSLAVNGLLAYAGGSTSSNASNQASANATVASSRINNAITYTTPTVNGVTGKFMYALGGVAGDNNANALYSGVLTANVAGVALSAGYETQNSPNSSSNTNKQTMLGAKYSIGATDLAAQYHTYKASDSTVDVVAYEIGAAYHLTPVATIGVNYENFNNRVAGQPDPKIISLKGKYDLSKRTYLYGMVADYNAAASTQIYQGYATVAPTATANKTSTNFAVGVVHGF